MATNETYDDFFDGVGEGGAPGFQFEKIGSGLIGLVVDMFKTVVTEPGKERKVKVYPDGTQIPQLNVTLQTELRDWAGIKAGSKSLLDEDGNPKPASEDDGLRRVFIKYDMRRAVAKAVKGTGATGLRPGGKLGIKWASSKEVGQANPLPLYEAMYEPPAAGDEFLNSTPEPASMATTVAGAVAEDEPPF